MLIERSRRTSVADVVDAVSDATKGPRRTRPTWLGSLRAVRAAVSLTVVAGFALAMLAVTLTARGRAEVGSAPPVGLYQSEGPVGEGPVGASVCVAVRLTDDAFRTGNLTLWWWMVGPKGCPTSNSGVVSGPARIAPVLLSASSDLPARVGYRVDYDLQLIPDGSETLTFTLDVQGSAPGGEKILARKGAASSGSEVQFEAVQDISVDEPGSKPPPTPRLP
jgi:hypothetical protein